MDGRYNNLITAKNVGIVTILCAATATIIILNQPTNKRKSKEKRKVAVALSDEQLFTIQNDLESRRQKILNEFESSNHSKIPEEMNNTMKYIVNDLEPKLFPPAIRLLASQLIQDYAIMFVNIHSGEPGPDPQVISLAKEWLNFECCGNSVLQIEQINHRYALALRSRSIKEFKHLFNWLQSMDANIREIDSIRQNWILRNFQCACLLGKWNQVKAFGVELEKVEPESLAANGHQQAPLHPLHLFEYIALKLPNQSANFTQVYYHVDRYTKRFDAMLAPPLRFTEWLIKNCTTQLTFGYSTNSKRYQELEQQVANATNKATPVPSSSRFMFVYGCLVQFPCFWVQLPASNTKMQPVVLTGPWNDSEMELTASYIRRVPKSADIKVKNGKKKGKGADIRVVRSDLRLKLDRGDPFKTHEDEKDAYDNKDGKKGRRSNGWCWNGIFEHEEGLLECNESDLNDFEFRRNTEWRKTAVKFTCRTWSCNMVISSPD